MGIQNIVRGHVNEILGLNNNSYEHRIAICLECPLYSPKLGGLCNNKLWLNPETGDVSTEEKEGFVQGCGCRLQAKTRDLQSHCIINKW